MLVGGEHEVIVINRDGKMLFGCAAVSADAGPGSDKTCFGVQGFLIFGFLVGLTSIISKSLKTNK